MSFSAKKRWLLFFLSLVFFYSCKSGPEVISVTVENDNALRAGFIVETTMNCEVQIELWSVNDSIKIQTKRTSNNTKHFIPIPYLQSNTKYNYRIAMWNAGAPVYGKPGVFTTNELPETLPGFSVLHKEEGFPGHIMIKKVHDPGMHILIDENADIRWYYNYDTVVFRPFSVYRESIISMINEKTFATIDPLGQVRKTFRYDGINFNKNIHHEIIRDENMNFLMLTRNDKVFDLSAMGGIKNDTIKGDGILVLDSLGHKIWEWDIFEFVDPTKYTDITETKDDWSHANSLSIDTDGNYLVSFRNFNQVWKIDSKSGMIIWRLGVGGDFEMEPEATFYLQHAAHINGKNELMLFDNGNQERKVSRAVSFDLDLDQMKANLKMDIKLPDSLFSFKQGSAYLINDDRVLFCSSIKNSIVITDLSGRILWLAKSNFSFYRAIYIEPTLWNDI